jgi:hypothetical protein
VAAYYPTPAVYVPVLATVSYQPCPVVLPLVVGTPIAVPAFPAAPAFARPTAAPPSDAPAIPGGPRTGPPSFAPKPAPVPAVSESRAYFDTYPGGGTGAAKVPADRCSVAFWNLSGQDLSLKVDGQARPLPRGRSVTLTLGRQFVWQVEGREPQKQEVPMKEAALEIVIRR